jgi:hypothetical protein
MRRAGTVVLASVLAASTAYAQPAEPGKGDAKALLQSGLKLFAAKDYLGALSVFETAYARFPSGKILLNIGTTLLKLERNADAANAYQRYLDAKDGDPAKRAEVEKVVADLDRSLGVLEITVEPTEAEVQVGAKNWVAAAEVARHRVDRGTITVRARKTGFVEAEQSVRVDGGQKREVALVLAAEPVITTTTATSTDGGIRAGVVPESRSRLGAIAKAHIDPSNKGAAVIVGLTADVINRVQVQATALLGPASGAYVGGSFAFLDGRVRPTLAAGVPVFFSDGPRVAVRGAAGVELAINRHFAVIAELGVEYLVNPEPGVSSTLFIPAIGATARL